MNRRDALKGIGSTALMGPVGAIASGVAVSTNAIVHPPNRDGWPDRVSIETTPLAKNMRPYLDGRRVYGGIDACESEGWIRVWKMEPDNHTGGAKPVYPRRYDLLRGRVEFRTVRPDGSWPD